VSCYRRLIGRLLYLNTRRPDISLATQQLSQFLNAPTTVHYKAACRILRYLKYAPGLGLLFPRKSEAQILGYVDADWAGCVDTSRSTTGFCFFLALHSYLGKQISNKIDIWQVYQNYRSSNKYRSTRTVLISIIARTLFVRMSKCYFVCPRQ